MAAQPLPASPCVHAVSLSHRNALTTHRLTPSLPAHSALIALDTAPPFPLSLPFDIYYHMS